MAFTFSHPAAVVFFPKKHFETSALVIGSMLPDIGYFLPWVEIPRHVFHHDAWILALMPIGLLIYFVFHFHVKRTLFQLLPKKIELKFEYFPKTRYLAKKTFIKIVYSLMMGILTHILWDGITHHEDFGPKLFPFLEDIIEQSTQGTVRLYDLIQYYSSGLGLILMMFYIVNRLAAKKAYFKNIQPEYKFKETMILLLIIINVIYLANSFYFDIHGLSNKPWFAHILVASASLNFLLFWVLSILNPKQPQDDSHL